MTTIYLVRHAEAEGNLYRRIHGRYNALITENGFRQIEALEKRFEHIHIDAVYSSDLFRTMTTAGAVYKPAGVKAMGGNLGGTAPMPFGSIKIFPAIHGSGVAGGLACGFVIEMGGKKIYHAGDTALMADMALLEEEGIDAALLPIGDFYTMGPKDALRAVKMIRPGLTVPMHYNTFPAIRQDPAAFAASVTGAGFAAKVLNPGESISL